MATAAGHTDLLPAGLADHGLRAEASSWNWRDDVVTERALTVPTWLPCLLFALLPAAWEARYRRGLGRLRRTRRGLCPACGYDLRATPGRCPECGNGASAAA